MPFDAVVAIDVKRTTVLINGTNNRQREVDVYKPTLEWRRDDGSTARETLQRWYDPDRADDFAIWLCSKVLLSMAA